MIGKNANIPPSEKRSIAIERAVKSKLTHQNEVMSFLSEIHEHIKFEAGPHDETKYYIQTYFIIFSYLKLFSYK